MKYYIEVLKGLVPNRYDIDNFLDVWDSLLEFLRDLVFFLMRPLVWITFPVSIFVVMFVAYKAKQHSDRQKLKREKEIEDYFKTTVDDVE